LPKLFIIILTAFLVPAIIYPTKTNWNLITARINPVHQNFFEAIFGIENAA